MNTNNTTITPNDAEREIIARSEKRLARAEERYAESTRMLDRKISDRDFGMPVSNEEIARLTELKQEDGELVARMEQERADALAGPALRLKRDARAAELRDAATAVDAEISDAIERLAVALDKGDALAHTVGVEFGDPQTGYRTLLQPFKHSTITIRLKFWRSIIRKEKIAEYRRVSAPQVSAPVTAATPKPTTGRILSRAEKAIRDAAMRATTTIGRSGGVVVTESSR